MTVDNRVQSRASERVEDGRMEAKDCLHSAKEARREEAEVSIRNRESEVELREAPE
jgi:hypothetical protein